MRAGSAAFVVMLVTAVPASAQGQHVDVVTSPASVKWQPAPPVLPKGAEIAVLSGNPFAAGPYVLRLKLPANYRIPAHHHPTAENVTVISGSFHAGMGDKLDMKNGLTFRPGGFVSMPANMNHYAWAGTETVVQVHGNGPFAITYVNPADDPSKKE